MLGRLCCALFLQDRAVRADALAGSVVPERRVLLPGDNVYRAFPNLYTIRGTLYRDVLEWTHSIDAMRALLDNNKLGSDEWLAWAMKRMLAVSNNDDVQGVMDMLAEVEERLPKSD